MKHSGEGDPDMGCGSVVAVGAALLAGLLAVVRRAR